MPRPEKDKVINDQVVLHMMDEGLSLAEIGRKLGVTRQAIYQRKKKYGRIQSRNVLMEHSDEIVQRNVDFGANLSVAARDAKALLDSLRLKKDKESQELSLKAMSEIRSQATAWASIMKDLISIEEMRKILDEMLDVIASVDENARREIIARLREKHLIRGVFTVS